ncbi:MAG: MBL fold metallo-hydrolase [Gammaproteobacteria bacterium]|nr:MBL fold metallo-hydrolase [Gammaproteobacteria bacterium]
MRGLIFGFAGILTLSVAVSAYSQEIIETKTHRLEIVADGVYFATGNGALHTMSNALIIERDDDIVLVDSHITPSAGRALLESIRTVSDKPVTTLINSHFHYDHSYGVPAFGDIQIIGHEYTREKLSHEPLNDPTYQFSLTRFNNTLAALEARLADTGDPTERAEIQSRIEYWQAHIKAQEENDPAPPTISMSDRMTLFAGGREIQIHFFGRAHTGGDVAVYLPQEKIVFTGDMLLGRPSFMGDGYVSEWSQTLENLKQLDFELILPGHGPAFTDRERINHIQAYYRDFNTEILRLKEAGLSAEEAAARADLRAYKNTLGINQLGADLRAVKRVYALKNKTAD